MFRETIFIPVGIAMLRAMVIALSTLFSLAFDGTH